MHCNHKPVIQLIVNPNKHFYTEYRPIYILTLTATDQDMSVEQVGLADCVRQSADNIVCVLLATATSGSATEQGHAHCCVNLKPHQTDQKLLTAGTVGPRLFRHHTVPDRRRLHQ